jgi:hypothetical protein
MLMPLYGFGRPYMYPYFGFGGYGGYPYWGGFNNYCGCPYYY